jgi:hypothetical protein
MYQRVRLRFLFIETLVKITSVNTCVARKVQSKKSFSFSHNNGASLGDASSDALMRCDKRSIDIKLILELHIPGSDREAIDAHPFADGVFPADY